MDTQLATTTPLAMVLQRPLQLTNLPVELQALTVAHLAATDFNSLGALALASSHFCALARAKQFASIRVTHDERSVELVKHLLNEVAAREAAGPLPPTALAPNVRELRIGLVHLNPRLPTRRDRPPFPAQYILSHGDRDGLNDKYSVLLAQLATLLRPGVLPLLRLVDTGPRFQYVVEPLWHRILACSLRHLRLRAVSSPRREPRLALLSWEPRRADGLDSLEVDIVDDACTDAYQWDLCGLLVRLILRSGPDLRELRVPNLSRRRMESDHPLPVYEKLRTVVLNAWFGPSFIHSVLRSAPELDTLGINLWEAEVAQGLERAGPIRTLKTLVCFAPRRPKIPEETLARVKGFLAGCAALKELCLLGRINVAHLADDILPLVAGHHKLTRLSVRARRARVPKRLFEVISRIRSLEHLHVAAGPYGDRPYLPRTPLTFVPVTGWLVDHDEVRRLLAPLNTLETLAFTGDDYVIGADSNLVPEGAPSVTHRRLMAHHAYSPMRFMFFRETTHMRARAEEAAAYMETLPSLEGVVMGGATFVCEDDDGYLEGRWNEQSSHERFDAPADIFGLPLSTTKPMQDELQLGLDTLPLDLFQQQRVDRDPGEQMDVDSEDGDSEDEADGMAQDEELNEEDDSDDYTDSDYDSDDEYDSEYDDNGEGPALARFYCETCFLRQHREVLAHALQHPEEKPRTYFQPLATGCDHRREYPNSAYQGLKYFGD